MRFLVPTGQFFEENCEIWSPILQKMAPKIEKLGEIYAQTLNLKVRIHHFSKITENIKFLRNFSFPFSNFTNFSQMHKKI